MLGPATQHTDAWKRATYRIQPEGAQALLETGVEEFVRGHQHPVTGVEYPVNQPKGARIVAEEFDYSDGSGHQSVQLAFHYDLPDREFTDIRVVVEPGSPKITSYVFASEFVETGYEGHGHRTTEATTEQLQELHDVLEQNTQGNLVPEEPIMERLERMNSLKELQDELGEITPAEQRLLDSIDSSAEPTPEELEAMGPDFTERVIRRTMDRIHAQQNKSSQ